MENGMIMVFAGKVLEKKEFISAPDVQREIANDQSVLKVIPIEDIEVALDMLVTAGFLDLHILAKDTSTLYKRFIPVIKRGRHG